MEPIWINKPDNLDDEAMKMAERLVELRIREMQSLCVIYHPNCKCPFEQMVILDRVPMSKKIISICPECKKGCLMEISDPIKFYHPLTDHDFGQDELMSIVFSEKDRQASLIKAYQSHFSWIKALDRLEKALESIEDEPKVEKNNEHESKTLCNEELPLA